MNLDVDIKINLQDQERTFDLEVVFQCQSPYLVIQGESGAGKTSLLRALCGFLKPESGHILCDEIYLYQSGNAINAHPSDRKMGYVPQSIGLFPHLSVMDNTLFARRGFFPLSRGAPERAEARELLRELELEGLEHARPYNLSGGQKQRVALARALMSQPDLLLLDEPFSMLHDEGRQSLRRLLHNLQKTRNLSIALVSHDRQESLNFQGPHLLMQEGKCRQVD